MISVTGISKSYATGDAIKNVNLTVDKGKILAVLGPSGGGKTTLLRLIAGLERPDSGIIELNGQKASDSEKIIIPPSNRKLSMIFQDLALWPHMSVFEHVKFILNGVELPKSQILDHATKILCKVHLHNKLYHYPHQLSGGEKQRLAIARAICSRPFYLLMDEPFSSLDVVLKQEMMDLILKLKKDYHMTVIYVTHELQEAAYLADRVVILNNGRIVWSGYPNEINKWTITDIGKFFRRHK